MKIYLLLAHPDSSSFNGLIADAYEKAAVAKGHEVRRQNLGDLQFDPILWKGYKKIQELEPDLQRAQENIQWCSHWTIIYPVWWGSMPALLKGFMDRVMLPSFAFQYHKNDPFWDKLLKGRSARLISTSDSPQWWLTWHNRNSDLHTLKNAILKFSGFSPVKHTRIGNMKYLYEEKRMEKLEMVSTKLIP